MFFVVIKFLTCKYLSGTISRFIKTSCYFTGQSIGKATFEKFRVGVDVFKYQTMYIHVMQIGQYIVLIICKQNQDTY